MYCGGHMSWWESSQQNRLRLSAIVVGQKADARSGAKFELNVSQMTAGETSSEGSAHAS